MKLVLANYKEGERVEVHSQYDPKSLDLEFVDLKYLSPLSMQGYVEKGPDTIFFRGKLTSETERLCGRCIITVKLPLRQSFDLIYETKDKEEIDTTDDLREVIVLDHPLSFLCRENCKGLCPVCGVNRNETKCKCVEKGKSRSSSFGNLKEIWNKKMKEKSHGKS